jgi:hypothetical protein
MDTILSIIGLALGVASLVPAFASKNRKKKIIFVAVGLSVAGIFAFRIYEAVHRQSEISAVKSEMLEVLAAKGPLPFDDLLDRMYYPNYSEVDEAIDQLVEEKMVTSDLVDVQSTAGAHYKTRFYRVVENRKK